MKSLLIVCASIAMTAFGSNALAQYTGGDQPAQPAPQTTAPAANAPATNAQADITGQTIYNSKGRAIGTVSQLTTDAQGQQVAVVKVGQYLGMGSKSVELPMTSLQARAKGGYQTSLSESEIKKLPEHKS